MNSVWTQAAIRDLIRARGYIARENPTAAREIPSRIVDATERIIRFPEVGRIGIVKGAREVAVPGTQYLIVYRLKKKAVHFLRVPRDCQEWPKGK